MTGPYETTRDVPGKGERPVLEVSLTPDESRRFHRRSPHRRRERLVEEGLPAFERRLYQTNDSDGTVFYFVEQE